jgi:hypothetical protein
MHIKTLIKTVAAIGILLAGVAACDNAKPTDTALSPQYPQTTTASDGTLPGNDIATTLEAVNGVSQPTTTPPGDARNNVAGSLDEPRGNPDRRTVTSTTPTTEPK